MSINANEKYVAGSAITTTKRYEARKVNVKTFAAGSGVIAKLQPVVYDDSVGFWKPWSGKKSETTTISSSGTISGGNFTITVNGETTANIAHNANAAAVQAALEALGGIDPGDVTVTGGPLSTNTSLVLTWGGQWTNKAIAVSITSSLTGGGTATCTETQAGVTLTGIRGFAAEDITLNASDEILGNVIMSGVIHFDDIPVPSDSTAAELRTALREGVRQFGFEIQGLTKFR